MNEFKLNLNTKHLPDVDKGLKASIVTGPLIVIDRNTQIAR